MATPKRRLLFSWDDVELLPDLQRLQFVLDHLSDEEILAALERRDGLVSALVPKLRGENCLRPCPTTGSAWVRTARTG